MKRNLDIIENTESERPAQGKLTAKSTVDRPLANIPTCANSIYRHRPALQCRVRQQQVVVRYVSKMPRGPRAARAWPSCHRCGVTFAHLRSMRHSGRPLVSIASELLLPTMPRCARGVEHQKGSGGRARFVIKTMARGRLDWTTVDLPGVPLFPEATCRSPGENNPYRPQRSVPPCGRDTNTQASHEIQCCAYGHLRL
jgi:hypothetical protein